MGRSTLTQERQNAAEEARLWFLDLVRFGDNVRRRRRSVEWTRPPPVAGFGRKAKKKKKIRRWMNAMFER